MSEECRLITAEELNNLNKKISELSSKALQLEKKLDIAVKELKEIYGLSTADMDDGCAWLIAERCIERIEEVK